MSQLTTYGCDNPACCNVAENPLPEEWFVVHVYHPGSKDQFAMFYNQIGDRQLACSVECLRVLDLERAAAQ